MPRVLHVISGLGAGGAQRVLARLIAATESSWDHRVVSLVESPRDAGHDDIAPDRVHGLGLRHPGNLPSALLRLRRVERHFRPSVVQGWMYHGNLAAWMSGAPVARAPLVWNIRHSPEGGAHQGLATRLTVRANAFLSRNTAAIVFNSARSMELHKRLGFGNERMRVIPNGFDTRALAPRPDLRQAWRIRQHIPADALVFGHAGRFHSVKNHAGAVRAFAVLAAERQDAWLAMVGEGVNADSTELREAARSSQCAERVLLLDRQTDMVQFYNGIDVLLLSSWAEAMPNVVGEAMACARPCITTDVGDAAALVGDTGWVARSPESESLLVALRSATQLRPQELQELGLRARVRVEREFSLDRMVHRYTELYEEVIGGAAQESTAAKANHG